MWGRTAKRGKHAGLASALASCIALASCNERAKEQLQKHPIPAALSAVRATAEDPFDPLPDRVDVNPQRAALGEKLFSDPALSGDGSTSCATCHPLAQYGCDRKPRSPAPRGAETAVNTPTVFNVAFDSRLSWQGKFESFEEHADGLIANPRAMASSWPQIVDKLRPKPEYVRAFSEAYAEGLAPATVRDALISYQRSLVTPNAPFDRFLRGEHGAMSPDELEGYALFKSYGCATCHQGVNIGGNLLEKLGVMRDYFADRGNVVESDFGRFNVTKDERDRFVFRVPSLRNVAKTAPYLHDASAATLEDAVTTMARYQLGRALSGRDTRLIVAFLETLSGELPKRAP